MDFFQRQEIARRHTKFLEVYFALAVIATVVTLYLCLVPVYYLELGGGMTRAVDGTLIQPSLWWNWQLFLTVTVVTLAVIASGWISKSNSLANGGSSVAEMLGGKPIDAHTTNPDQRKLLNVVEEMAIASGTPVPQVYFLPNEQGINAFAAGHSTGDMVICVTAGALKYLNRDELQGVIGHEFSHILNGDMKLNLRLMGIIFGIICLSTIGNILISIRDRKGFLLVLNLTGLILIVVGSIGVFFSRLIKSAVSRQREFLADASSAQFTRNPGALADALKKVGSSGSRIDDPNAEDASHFFFANGLTESWFGWMSTHPSLEQRIRLLDPAWDGQFIQLPKTVVQPRDDADTGVTTIAPPRRTSLPRPLAGTSGPAFIGNVTLLGMAADLGDATAIPSAQVVPSVGVPTAQHLDHASDLLANLPPSLSDASRSPMSAAALIYALLLNRDENIRANQLQQFQSDPAMSEETTKLLPDVLAIDGNARLPLVTLSITALRGLSPDQYDQFTQNLGALVVANNQPDLFAYALQKIVQRRLDPSFHPVTPTVPQYYALKPLLPDCAVLLSAVAYAGQTDPTDIENAFNQGRKILNVADADLPLAPASPDFNQIDSALDRLNTAAPQIKKSVLTACAMCADADGQILESEAELLRAIADTLDIPIPRSSPSLSCSGGL